MGVKKPEVRHGSPGAGAHVRMPAGPSDVTLYREHYQRLCEYTDALREGRCRRTRHFDDQLGATVSVFGPLFSPWNMDLLFALYMRDRLRFNELKRSLAPVSSRVLSDKLAALGSQGIVTRRAHKRQVSYALTPRGGVIARHLHPLVFFLHNDGQDADGKPGRPTLSPTHTRDP